MLERKRVLGGREARAVLGRGARRVAYLPPPPPLGEVRAGPFALEDGEGCLATSLLHLFYIAGLEVRRRLGEEGGKAADRLCPSERVQVVFDAPDAHPVNCSMSQRTAAPQRVRVSSAHIIDGVLIVSPLKMPPLSVPSPLHSRKILGSGRGGLYDSSRATARGLRGACLGHVVDASWT